MVTSENHVFNRFGYHTFTWLKDEYVSPDLVLYPLKTPENQRLFYVFMGYRKRPVAQNGLWATLFHQRLSKFMFSKFRFS